MSDKLRRRPAGGNPLVADESNRDLTLLPGEPILLRRRPDGAVEMVQNSGIVPTTATRKEEKQVGIEDVGFEAKPVEWTISTLSAFQLACVRTWNNHLTTEEKKHSAVYGLIGEVGELVDYQKKVQFHQHPNDPKKVENELGDVAHYVAVLALLFNINLDDVYATSAHESISSIHEGIYKLSSRVGDLSQYLWSTYFQREEECHLSLIQGHIARVLRAYLALTDFLGFDMMTVANSNIDKLKARYPDGFSTEASLNRKE